MIRLLKEPLVHFFVLGAVIFMAYGTMPQPGGAEPGKITITQAQIDDLAAGFTKTWKRPPTADELANLVRDRVKEEVYYREALALGLDKDDPIIRRRLRQKMEFVSQDLAAPAEPSEAELRSYLAAHAARFAAEPRFSFRQVHLDPQRRGANLARDAERMLASLKQAGAEASLPALGDSILLDKEYDNVAAGELGKMFGTKFATTLDSLPPGQWHGPIESGYGMHLVFLSRRTGGGQPSLEEVRETVRREWINARQHEAAERSYQALLQKYGVAIEGSSAGAGSPQALAVRQ